MRRVWTARENERYTAVICAAPDLVAVGGTHRIATLCTEANASDFSRDGGLHEMTTSNLSYGKPCTLSPQIAQDSAPLKQLSLVPELQPVPPSVEGTVAGLPWQRFYETVGAAVDAVLDHRSSLSDDHRPVGWSITRHGDLYYIVLIEPAGQVISIFEDSLKEYEELRRENHTVTATTRDMLKACLR